MILHPGVKINLGLNILRKRPDGYHDLETLFVPVSSLHDTLEVVTGEGYGTTADHICEAYEPAQREQAISADGKLMITVARREGVHWDPLHDLCVKAYFLLAEDFKLPPIKIFLEKNSPVGAGLGGGSADAAFTLRAIDQLCGLGLSDAALASYAARLGADCPFFIYNRPMFASGRGEILEEFDLVGAFGSASESDGLPFRVELVIPEGISISTREAYRGVTPALPPIPLREVLHSPSTWKENLRNDFEASVFRRHPELAVLKADLYARGAFYAAMSGSGSALFGLFEQ